MHTFSFVVVFRSQLAYNRYFGALTSYFRLKARLLNLVYLTKALALNNGTQAVKTKATIARWVRLYHKLAITQLRGGYVQDIDVKNLVQHRELEILVASRARTHLVTSWILRGLSENFSEFTAPPPIVGRLFQIASDLDLEFSGALQVATTPFPFPYAQITVVLLNIWLFTTPLFVSRWIKDAPFLTACLSFVSTWIIFAVNEAAANIESPFDGDDNDGK
jgi:predicted membrane chloride channel (bestrophin family)